MNFQAMVCLVSRLVVVAKLYTYVLHSWLFPFVIEIIMIRSLPFKNILLLRALRQNP